jgi:hypothetical protein
MAFSLSAENPAPGEINRSAHDGERKRENDAVGDNRSDTPRECQLERARSRALNGTERSTGDDLPAQRSREPTDDLVVAAANVVFLVGRTEESKLTLPGKTEQVEEIQRALLCGLFAVLDRVRDFQQLAEH